MKINNRREFLIKSSQLASLGLLGSQLPFLNSCSTVDQYFTPSTQFLTDRVVIVGAGLAGLTAAYELKKQKIPFCIFEAQQVCGGRISSVKFVNSSGALEIHERGADFFDRRHFRVFELVKELGLKVEEQDESLNSSLALEGKLSRDTRPLEPYFRMIARDRLSVFDAETGDLSNNFSAIPFDQISVEEYLERVNQAVDPQLKVAFMKTIEQAWGALASEISALQFLYQFDHESAHSPFSSVKRYRVAGGNQEMIDRLLMRVDSIVPNYVLRPAHELIAIRPRSLMNELVFKAPGGEKSYYCKNVLMTLPLGKLKEVEGWSSVGLPSDFLKFINEVKMSHHSKASLAYKRKFWSKKMNSSGRYPWFEGQIFGDWPFHNLSEVVSRKSGSEFETSKPSSEESGSLLIQSGDRFEESLFSQILSKPSRSFVNVWPDSEKYFDRIVSSVNWSLHPSIRGSRAVFGPGQFLRRSAVWKKVGAAHQIQFAGEHVSDRWPGTMEGAMDSALHAVQFFKSPTKGRG